MITEWETNVLYLADTLPVKCPGFYQELTSILDNHQIDHRLLLGTSDIWARDYMPVQVSTQEFVQFVYKPDYLKSPIELKSITDVDKVLPFNSVHPKMSHLIVDGGNLIHSKDKVIMCDKVFKENQSLSREAIINELQQVFQTELLYFIPTHPDDWTGHADGLVRFIDEQTVFVNDFKGEDEYKQALLNVLKELGLAPVLFPYNPYRNRGYTSARGFYINFLVMKDIIIVPLFGLKEDAGITKVLEHYYSGKMVKAINCNAIARQGGVLNCISWNVKQ